MPPGRAPKPRVLCVDDEPHVLESLRDGLRRRFDVTVTTNGFQALKILSEQPCEVVLSDMRMPMLNGARFLTLAREHSPDTVRLLLTGQSTVNDAVAAVNEGEVFRFLVKPCPVADLTAALESAVARHRALIAERDRAEQAVAHAARALAAIAATIDPSASARAERILRHGLELASAASAPLDEALLGLACELAQIGTVALSPETRAQLDRRSRLGREQAEELERLPELAARFVGLMPELAPAAALLSATAAPLEPGAGGATATPPEARVLRIVCDFELLEARGTPVGTALETMRRRAGRYDRSLLEVFAGLQETR